MSKNSVRKARSNVNEGRTCDAVVKFLEKYTGETCTDIRFPENDGVGPPVDLRLKLGTNEYAIEHTRIESFENQIGFGVPFGQISDHIADRISDNLPGRACYQLNVPVDVSLPERSNKRERVLDDIIEWIQRSAFCMEARNTDQFGLVRSPIWHEDCVTGIPQRLGYKIELRRSSFWPRTEAHYILGRKPGSIIVCPVYPVDDDLEKRRFKRLRRAFERKFPKLERCRDEGARTVLVLESVESSFTRFVEIGNVLPVLLAMCTDAPDEIYLVESGISWLVYPMKRDDVYWPDNMPRYGEPICEEGTPMMESHCRALPRGWLPEMFDQDELKNFTQDAA